MVMVKKVLISIIISILIMLVIPFIIVEFAEPHNNASSTEPVPTIQTTDTPV